MIQEILIIYWVVTSIYGAYYIAKTPTKIDAKEEFSLFDVASNIFPAMFISPFAVPLCLLNSIKLKKIK